MGLIWLAATVALVAFCGFMGLKDVGRTTLPIEQIEVMQNRVLADNPEIEGLAPGQFGPIDPPNWRLFDLRLDKPDGGWVEIRLGRPAGSLQQTDAQVGDSVHLDLAELGVVGDAQVLALRPCPTPNAGDGRVVTGKFVHCASNVLEFSIEGLSEPLRVTANHLIWSADRGAYVPAGELREGERLRSHDGQAMPVISLVPLNGVHRVYNLEVDGKHVYCVGSAGVLVHNMCPPGPISVTLKESKNFGDQSHGGRAKQFLEQLTGKKITAKLKAAEGTQAVLRGWEEQIANGTLVRKGVFIDPKRREQGAFEMFEGAGFTLIRGLDGSLRSLQRTNFKMAQRLIPLEWTIIIP